MRNGNVAQGAVVNGTFEGQGLHFRWGDGTVFKCKDLTICFENNRLVRANGTFTTRKSNSRRRNRRRNGRIVEFDDGWTVGGTIYFLNGDVRMIICILHTIQSFVEVSVSFQRYVGPSVGNTMQGNGTFYWRDGREFKGQKKDDSI